jgi:hypothetical protein
MNEKRVIAEEKESYSKNKEEVRLLILVSISI